MLYLAYILSLLGLASMICASMTKGEKMNLPLKNRDEFKLYTFTPIVDEFAVVGLKDKFMSPLTVKCVNGRDYELYEEGVCLVYKDGKFVEE